MFTLTLKNHKRASPQKSNRVVLSDYCTVIIIIINRPQTALSSVRLQIERTNSDVKGMEL